MIKNITVAVFCIELKCFRYITYRRSQFYSTIRYIALRIDIGR